jgi:hypothetical protein
VTQPRSQAISDHDGSRTSTRAQALGSTSPHPDHTAPPHRRRVRLHEPGTRRQRLTRLRRIPITTPRPTTTRIASRSQRPTSTATSSHSPCAPPNIADQVAGPEPLLPGGQVVAGSNPCQLHTVSETRPARLPEIRSAAVAGFRLGAERVPHRRQKPDDAGPPLSGACRYGGDPPSGSHSGRRSRG